MACVTIIDKVLAIIWLRARISIHSLRRDSGVANLLSTVVIVLTTIGISIGIAILFGFLVYSASRSGDLDALHRYLNTAFFTFLVLGLVLPVFLQSIHLGIDTSRFWIFPIGKIWLYAVSVCSTFGSGEHVIYYPALAVICITGVITAGINAFLGLLAIFLILLFYVISSNTVALALHAIMRKRRTREVFSIIYFVLLISVLILFSVFDSNGGESSPYIVHAKECVRSILPAGKVLPPAIATEGIIALYEGEKTAALQNIMWLFIWVIATTAIGYFVFITISLGERGKTRKTATAREPADQEHGERHFELDLLKLSHLPKETFAVASMELRYLLRSPTGKLNLLLAPCIMAFYVLLFTKGIKNPVMGIRPEGMVFFGISLYLSFIASNFVCNSFRWESGGIQSYFFSPAPLSFIIAGKNIGATLYYILYFGICVVTWAALTKINEPMIVVTGLLIFANSITAFIIIGNILSIRFPVARDISRMKSSASQTTQLLSFVLSLFIIIPLSAALFLPHVLGISSLQTVFLALLLVLQLVIYFPALKTAARLMENEKEKLISCMMEKNK